MPTHVVCRGCDFEALVTARWDVDRVVSDHEEDTGHEVDHQVVDEGKQLVTDGGEDQELLEVCPHCDSSSLQSNSGGGYHARVTPTKGDYRCNTCGRHFDEPNTRPKKRDVERRGLAGQLSEANPDAVSGDDLVTDGGREYALPGDDIWRRLNESDIGIGDVVVDLARGKSLQVVSVATQPAGEHERTRSDRTAEMFGADADDLVFNCVFLPTGEDSISPPSKTYAYPESRLLRYPVEEATPNARLQREWLSNVLEQLAVVTTKFDDDRQRQGVFRAVDEAFGEDVVETLEEFAEAAGGDP